MALRLNRKADVVRWFKADVKDALENKMSFSKDGWFAELLTLRSCIANVFGKDNELYAEVDGAIKENLARRML